MKPKSKSQRRPRPAAGFTLVELLVSLGLVSLLLLMFAQIFQIATDTMSTQRGLMENDQRARALTTILTNDLNNRTTRSVIPFQPNETDYTNAGYYSFSQRQGFLSISENDPLVDIDDVLHFTVLISQQNADDAASSDTEVYYGRATGFPLGSPNLTQYQNQPDADDAIVFTNQAASSSKAEIVYFVRNGNLYRRVLLLREPLDPTTMDRQPNNLDYSVASPPPALDIFEIANGIYPAGSDFWNDFDFSATWPYAGPSGARFIGGGSVGVDPLNNGATGSLTYAAIARPPNRFGHNPILAHGNGSGAAGSVGNPREFLGTLFLGRFTHEETSHTNFNYPHSAASVGTLGVPVDSTDTPAGTLNDTAPSNGVVDEFAGGPRRGQDLLLSNVHSFDVKVWDEIIQDYVDIGHSLTNGVDGDFHQARNRRPTYGPDAAGNNRMFDTWHPQFNANNQNHAVSGLPVDVDDIPPFLPKSNYNVSSNFWQASAAYNVGDLVIANTTLQESFYYRMVSTTSPGTLGTTGQSGLIEPINWPTAHGARITDNEVVWEAVYNIKRIKSLKITVRYLDVSSDQMRQVSLIQSLIN